MSLDLDEVHINKEESCAKKLLLENVPPPPKSQPPRIDELTSALEKQLSEIEKHVVEKRKQSAEQKASSIELAQKTITGQQQKLPVLLTKGVKHRVLDSCIIPDVSDYFIRTIFTEVRKLHCNAMHWLHVFWREPFSLAAQLAAGAGGALLC